MFRASVAVCALATALSTAGSAAGQAMPQSRDAARAQASFAALQRVFGTSDGSGLYREWYPTTKGERRYSTEWPFSQIHVAALDLTGLPNSGSSYDDDLTRADRAQMRYWAKNAPGGHPGFLASPLPPYGKFDTLFYDDNEWVGLEAMQDYAQSPSQPALGIAQKIFDLAVSGWDTDDTHTPPGGVKWTLMDGNTARNTVSNMPAAELGLRLYLATERQRDLTWAMRMYNWTNHTLQRADGLYYDHVDPNGHVDRSIWSYNQGVPIAVNLLLYRITKSDAYLQEAQRISAAAYQYFVVGGRLSSQPLSFNAIFLKHALALEAQTGGSQWRAATQSYADSIWRDRDSKTGLIHVGGSSSRTDVIEQAAATQIFAMLAWSSGDLVNVA